jgi:hypothetical protein
MVSWYEVLRPLFLEELPGRGFVLQVDRGKWTKVYPRLLKVEQVHTELKLSKDNLGHQSKMRILMVGKGGYAVHLSRRRMGKCLQASELTGRLLK